MHTFHLHELAAMIDAEISGDANVIIRGVANLSDAGENQVTFFNDQKRLLDLKNTKAGAVILSPKFAKHCPSNAIITPDPYLGYARLAHLFDTSPRPEAGVHPCAVVADSVRLAENVSIGANAVIADNVFIGANTIIGAGCSIGENVSIGANCHLHANVTVYYDVQIADQVIILSGAVIGADGFGFAHDGRHWVKIPQLGSVHIGYGVEIGANTCVDRGALNNTIIEEGVKIDDQVLVAHNVHIGAHTAIAGCTGIAGSAKIGRNCRIGGGACINGHLEIADNTTIVGTTTVSKSLKKPDIYVSGTGMSTHRQWRRNMVRFHQLDNMAKRIALLEKQLSQLSEVLSQASDEEKS